MQQLIISLALDTAAVWNCRGWEWREIKKGAKAERYYIYLYRLVYELKYSNVTSHTKTEVQVQTWVPLRYLQI